MGVDFESSLYSELSKMTFSEKPQLTRLAFYKYIGIIIVLNKV